MVYRLPNGLTVVLQENHAAPVVALQAWIQVGGADERPDEVGLAHLHEHMLFKGTRRRGLGQIASEVEARGGEINAWTSHDQTVYHLVLASAFVEDGLDILADALRESSFDPDELGREIEVVVEEIKRSEDSPEHRLSRELFRAAYAKHPYGRPVIGTPESVRSFTRPQILGFYRRHYSPLNAVLAVVGDFTPVAALEAVERTFGTWKAEAPPEPRRREAEPAQQGARASVLRGDFRETRLALAFHIPAFLHADVPALDLLAAVLGHGESSRLPRLLKRAERLFRDVYSYAYTPQDAGLWVVGGTPVQGREREAIGRMLALLDEARRAPVSPDKLGDELAIAKRMLAAEQVYQRETVQGVARKLGFYQTVAGTLEAEAEYLARLQGTSAADLQEVANRYLSATQGTFVVLEAEGAPKPLTEAELTEALAAGLPATPGGAARPREKPASDTTVFKLHGGATLLVKPETDIPLVAVRAAFPGGVRLETEADNGVTALLARTLTRGARGRSADAIAAAVDGMAGALGGVGGRNTFGLHGQFLSQYVEQGLKLFMDCLLAPDFPAAEVERERAQLLQQIRAREDHPSSLVFELFAKTLFTRHPNRLSMAGELSSVERLGPTELGAAIGRYGLDQLTLAVVGDVRPAEVRDLIERELEPVGTRAPVASSIPQEPTPTAPRTARRPLDKAQTHLVVGFLGLSFADAGRRPLEVLGNVLAGQGGRLFRELRDKQSLAYSVTSFSVEGIDPGHFAVYIGTSPDKADQALAAIDEELARVRDAVIPEDELARSRQNLVGTHAISLQRRSAVAGALAVEHACGLGIDAYLRYSGEVQAVTADQVREVARRVLRPEGRVIARVGPEKGQLP